MRRNTFGHMVATEAWHPSSSTASPTATSVCAVAGTPWSEACRTALAPSATNARKPWQARDTPALLALPNAGKAELNALASSVVDILHERGVLCSTSGARGHCHASVPVSRNGQLLLQVCLPPARRVFCAPFASDRRTHNKARMLAAGCTVPKLPCQHFDLVQIALDIARLRAHPTASLVSPSSPSLQRRRRTPRGEAHLSAFFGPDDIDEVYGRLRRAKKSLPHLAAMLSPMRPPEAQIHRRCALVGANHVMRCRRWGARIDGPEYDAIFRVNGFQLDERRVPNQWLDPLHAGKTTTYRQSCLTGGRRLNSSRGEVCLLTPDFLSTQRDHTDHTQVCAGRRQRSEYTEHTVAQATSEGFRFLLFGRDAPYRSLSGEGSGDAAFLAALALCRTVDAYGVGLLAQPGAEGAVEAVYQHGYDPVVGRCDPRAVNTSCGVHAPYVKSQMVREVQWAVWHAMGLANWIWS